MNIEDQLPTDLRTNSLAFENFKWP